MCAICGIVNSSSQDAEKIVWDMLGAQNHRGPDGDGVFVARDTILGHRRLAVIDLSGGAQPLRSENDAVSLVANGEIYNYRELRAELESRGHRFKTNSDSEVIIHLYEEMGSECLTLLDGMFAFALYDAGRRNLLLARDRMGQKPLYYFMSGKELVFSSELSGLKCHPYMPKKLDDLAISDFLSFQYIRHPNTAFQRVHKLSPAHLLEYQLDSGNCSIRCFWRLNFANKFANLSFSAAAVELRRRVEHAVEKRLVSDVPLGVFLSGGVDSCIIAGVAARMLSPGRCNAFTVGFEESAYDERAAARLSAENINSFCGNLCCHEAVVDSGDFQLLKRLVNHFGEPYADASMLPVFRLCEFARKHITVALSGDGADELFGGYERYVAAGYAGRLDFLPKSLRRPLFHGLSRLFPDSGERTRTGRTRRMLEFCSKGGFKGYIQLLNRCPREMKEQLFGPELQSALKQGTEDRFGLLAWELSAANRVEKLSETDILSYLPGDILPKVDISSMAVGLEVRSPFLDREVVEFAARLPQKYKLYGSKRKRILISAFPDLITPELLGRPKRGFGVPVASWLRSSWKSEAENVLFNSRMVDDGYIKGGGLRHIWQEHQSGCRDHSYILWNLLVLALFLADNGQGK